MVGLARPPGAELPAERAVELAPPLLLSGGPQSAPEPARLAGLCIRG